MQSNALPAPMNVKPARWPLRIALVYSRMPLPMTRADQMTVAHLIAYLAARGHIVDLFTLDTGEAITAEQRDWLEARCRNVVVFRQGKLRSFRGAAAALCRGRPIQVGWFTNPAHIAAVRRTVGTGSYDVAYAYYLRSAEALRGMTVDDAAPFPGPAATFLAMQLSQALNTKRIAERSKRWRDKMVYSLEYRLMRAYEARVWQDFSRTVLISQTDVDEIQAVCRDHRLPQMDNYFLCPHGVDVNRFRPRPDIAEEPATLVFSGVMRTNTNINAVTWFVQNCWDAVKQAIPEARLVVVGRSPAPDVLALAKRDSAIVVTGEVPDPAEHIARATVCINPMQAGAGMQNKLLEYLASGKAVVATPVANEGIGATPDRHLLVATTPEAYAGRVVELLRNPVRRRALGAAARAYVERHWTWERWFEDLEGEMIAASGASRRQPDLDLRLSAG